MAVTKIDGIMIKPINEINITKSNSTTDSYDPKIAENLIGEILQKSSYNKPEFNSISDTYTIVMPPPNLTGSLHAGHAFEHFFMDTIARMARQRNKSTLYFPGVDHAGIQLEGVVDRFINTGVFDEELKVKYNSIFEVEKKSRGNYLKSNNLDLYLEFAWRKANEYRVNQLNLATNMGDSPDFDRLLFTLDPQSRKTVFLAFKKFWEDGIIYKGSYLINWSVALQTALSDVPEDIARVDINDPFITYRYDLENVIIKGDNSHIYDLKKEIYDALIYLEVGTVRIETATASKQLMAHPDVITRLFKQKTTLLNNQIQKIIEAIGSGQIIIQYQISAFDLYQVQLYLEDSLDPNFGTGVMKFTPAHDPNDYLIAKKHNISSYPTVINKLGNLTDECGKYSGLNVYKARVLMMVDLLQSGFVSKISQEQVEEISTEFDSNYLQKLSYEDGVIYLKKHFSNYNIDWNYTHNVIICERSKTVVEPLISDEFFVNYKQEFNHKPDLLWKLNKLDFTKLEIVCNNVRLRSIDSTFAPFLCKNLSKIDCDLLLATYFNNEAEADGWIKHQIGENVSKKSLTLTVQDLDNNFMGYCFVRFEERDFKLTVWISKQFRGKNHAFNAMDGFIKWIWANINTNKLVWEVKSENEASIGLCKKLGFKLCTSSDFENVNATTGQVTTGNFQTYSLNRNKTTLQKLALDGIEQTAFYPHQFKERGADYFNSIKDWCISRSLVWGIRIPIWYNIDLNPNKQFYNFEDLSKTIDVNGKLYQCKDLFQVSDDRPMLHGNWVQEEKILDTWFSSTLWPLSTLNFVDYKKTNSLDSQFAKFYPTQLMTSAWEIFYAWIVRMIMNGMYFTNNTPFESYCCHAWVLDEKGRKMSKSLGNVFDPQEQIDKFSIDATRLAMLSGAIPGKNMRFQGKLADNLCINYRNLGNKIYNIGKFFSYQFTLEENKLTEAYCKKLLNDNKLLFNLEIKPASIWIFKELVKVQDAIEKCMGDFNISIAVEEINNFVWNKYTRWYLEYLKTDSSQISIGYLIFNSFIRLVYPFMPFEAEFINKKFFNMPLLSENMLGLDYLKQIDFSSINEGVTDFETVMEVVEQIRSVKAVFGIDPVVEVGYCVSESLKYISQYQQFIQLLCKAKFNPTLVNSSNLYSISGLSWSVQLDILSKISNVEKEVEKTQQQLISIETQINSLNKMLEDSNFINNASLEIIEGKKTSLNERGQEYLNLQAKLNVLNNL